MKKHKLNSKIFSFFFIFIMFSLFAHGAGFDLWEYYNTSYSGTIPFGIETIDANNDGYDDIIIAENGNDLLLLLTNQKNNTFIQSTITEAYDGIQSLHVYDIDLDGFDDIVTSGDDGAGTDQNIRWYENDQDGTFTEHNLSTTRSNAHYVGDVNSDGFPDIAYSDTINNDVYYFKNNGDATFTNTAVDLTNNCGQPKAVYIDDVNSDGDNDIIATCLTTDNAYWYENSGDSTTFTPALIDGFNNPDYTESYDFDDDNDVDIVISDQDGLYLYNNNGFETFTKSTLSTVASSNNFNIIDIDGDGDNDILLGASSPPVLWFRNDGGSFTQISILSTPTQSIPDVTTGDFNGNGVIDVAVTSTTSTSAYIFINNFGIAPTFDECELPLLFCDDFNYGLPMLNKGWYIYGSGGVINTSFSPITNELNLEQNSTFLSPYHTTDPFIVNYTISEGGAIVQSDTSPVFTSEFNMNLINHYEPTSLLDCFRYTSLGSTGSAYNLLFCPNQSLYAKINITADNYETVCEGCIPTNTTVPIRIISHFSQKPSFNFNSSILNDKIEIYLSNTLIGTKLGFMDSDVSNLNKYYIIKEDDVKVTLDDYYVMIGTDKTINTATEFYEDIYTESEIEGSASSDDVVAQLDDFWSTIGLKSARSKAFFLLALIVIIDFVIIFALFSGGVNISGGAILVGIGLIDIMALFMGVILKLISVFIPVIIIIIVSGIGALMWKVMGD